MPTSAARRRRSRPCRAGAAASSCTTPTSSAGAASTSTAPATGSRRTTSTRAARSCGSWHGGSARRTARSRQRGSSRPDRHILLRPQGGRIDVAYSLNKITYRYDRKTNTYRRSVTGEKRQIDRGRDKQVAPKNVVIMTMSFGRLNDGSRKNRLEADFIGRGTAWIATNGKTIKGTWRKKSMTDPTRFYDAKGKQVTLTVGQTFVQVMPRGSKITIKDGKVPKYVPTFKERRDQLTLTPVSARRPTSA